MGLKVRKPKKSTALIVILVIVSLLLVTTVGLIIWVVLVRNKLGVRLQTLSTNCNAVTSGSAPTNVAITDGSSGSSKAVTVTWTSPTVSIGSYVVVYQEENTSVFSANVTTGSTATIAVNSAGTYKALVQNVTSCSDGATSTSTSTSTTGAITFNAITGSILPVSVSSLSLPAASNSLVLV